MLRNQTQGIPVCVTVSHVDGLVVARSGFHHSLNYRAVMAFGSAAIVADDEIKTAALNGFVDRLYPGRNRQIRPILPQELKATTLMSMVIDEPRRKSAPAARSTTKRIMRSTAGPGSSQSKRASAPRSRTSG